jgi:glycosyltransferase involved in cell wall biosynthesis
MTRQKIRVLHLLRSLGVGGTERRVLRLGAGLDPDRFEVHALSFYPVEGQALVWPSERHRYFPLASGFQWRRLIELVRYIRANRFDVVHSHNWATMFYGVMAGRLAGVPVVLHGEHGRNDIDRSGIPRRRELLASILARMATRVVAVNESISADIRQRWRIDERHVVCVPNGVDLVRFGPSTEPRTADREFVVGTVARFDSIKNLSCLLRAFERLYVAEPHLQMRLVLVGSGPQWEELHEQALRGRSAERIQFVGETTDPQDWHRRFDVFANTSLSEGMSNAILEAMACGVSVVASDIAGNRCWLRDGENALFFPSNDDVALAGCLRRLALDRDLSRRLGAENLRRARSEYDNRSFLDRYGALYRQLLSAAGR